MGELIRREELCKRLNLKDQTIYNMIYRNEFILNFHYFKPTKKILLFDWEAIQQWLRGSSKENKNPSETIASKPANPNARQASLINI